MNKIFFQISDKRVTFTLGIVLFGLEFCVFIFLLVLDSSFAAKILSMITANHVGGRLAFIGMGLEFNFSAPYLIFIIIFYNTTYLLLAYSLIVFLWTRTERLRIIKNFIESMKEKAKERTQDMKRWNWFSISLFVWLPLPWTGAVMGSLVAHIEGYNTKDTLLMVIPSMWIGVVSWTLWFDELYGLIESFGRGRTIFLTLFLLISPFLYYVIKNLIKKISKF